MVKSKTAASQLAKKLGLGFTGDDVLISGVSSIAGEVEPGDIFVALQGARHHGLDFLQEAQLRGAVAVLSDRRVSGFPSLQAPDPKALLGQVVSEVLGDLNIPLFGVTGTNGKTSTTNYLYQLLGNLGMQPAMAGSTGLVSPGGSTPSSLTSVELTTLRKFLDKFVIQGGQACALEVSAQALVRQRVAGVRFEVAGFTNLSRDHLDDFGSMEEYFSAKSQLFQPAHAKKAAVFVSDPWAKKLVAESEIPVLTIGHGQEVEFEFSRGVLKLSGKFEMTVEFGFGELMAKNLALAIGMLYQFGFSAQELEFAAQTMAQVPGRLERVSDSYPHTFVDYAHTPDGVKSALAEISANYPGVTILVSASGDRDKGKRFEMGQAAAPATRVIVTDQHPRGEDPGLIRAAVIAGLTAQGKACDEIPDPEKAIEFAVGLTPRDHAILWCGPGHLKYREIAGSKLPFDAIAIAKMTVENHD